jgi:hypothetical protein
MEELAEFPLFRAHAMVAVELDALNQDAVGHF